MGSVIGARLHRASRYIAAAVEELQRTCVFTVTDGFSWSCLPVQTRALVPSAAATASYPLRALPPPRAARFCNALPPPPVQWQKTAGPGCSRYWSG